MAANSDARAASWDRNLVTTINAYYDQSGNLLGVDPEAASSGKLFQEGIKPPHADEFILGTAQQITGAWSARVYGRYRKAQDFWEDTNNNARSRFGANVPGLNQADYISNLTALRTAIGSGSTTPSVMSSSSCASASRATPSQSRTAAAETSRNRRGLRCINRGWHTRGRSS